MIETIYLYNKRKESELEREKFKYIQLKNQLKYLNLDFSYLN